MRPTVRPLHLLALAYLVVTLVGCSTGTSRGPVSAGSKSAPSQVAAALFVQQWGQILWGLVASQTGTETPSFGTPVVNPDGSVSQSYRGVDGTEVLLTALLDGTMRLEITHADGSTQTVVQSRPEFDGVSVTSIDWQVTSTDGPTVSYATVVDDLGTIFDASDDTVDMVGTSTLPSGLTQQFTVRTAGGVTALRSGQSDGSVFTLRVPLAAPDFARPDFSQAATGSYTDADSRIEFTLSSTAVAKQRWATMVADFGGGMVGEASLTARFAGSGQLLQDEQLTAVVSWTSAGEMNVSFVTAERSDMSPAGAALDFLVNRWKTLTALFAPAPGVASLADLRQLTAAEARGR